MGLPGFALLAAEGREQVSHGQAKTGEDLRRRQLPVEADLLRPSPRSVNDGRLVRRVDYPGGPDPRLEVVVELEFDLGRGVARAQNLHGQVWDYPTNGILRELAARQPVPGNEAD